MIRACDVDEAVGRWPQYAAGLRWLDEFVTQPHPELGRPGAVCPRLAPALRARVVWMVTVHVPAYTSDQAVLTGRLLMRLFSELAEESDRSDTTLLAFFPDLPADRAADFIDGGHRLLRNELAEHGLMLGEFHPASTVGSVHNRALPVMRSPEPMFAVRTMTPHDLLFADQPDTPPAERLAYLLHFDRHVSARLSPAARTQLYARIAAARTASRTGASS
ncbi:DUF6875 domain-containing protein [Actinoplanes sp. G11-F43]|uniref:DUF6875 domain-containing protein n=1 Tax=Actinoplanes sp. G11-F43 TaxID=3424130 RepID=UPI003D357105